MTKTTGNFTDFVSFSRASGGTALRKISYGSELVTNGTFDTGISGWSNSSDPGGAIAWNPSGYLDLVNTSGTVRSGQTLNFVAGKVYRIGVTVVSVGGAASAALYFDNTSLLSFPVVGVGTHYVYFVAPSGPATINVRNFTTGTTVSVDNISVKEVLFDRADGTLQLFNHPTNVPRVEYDASGNWKGLLIEEARTNFVASSALFTGYSNSGAGQTIESGFEFAGLSASRITFVGDTVANYRYLQIPTPLPSTWYTVSLFVAAGTGNFTQEYDDRNFTGNRFRLTVNTATGATTYSLTVDRGDSAQAGSSGSYAVPGGWRVWAAFKTGSLAATNFVHMLRHSDVGSYVFTGHQIELGAFPTSYIPTTGATATRAADICSIATSAFGYNQGAGTIVVDIAEFKFGTSGFPRAVEIGNSSNNGERINVSVTAASGTYSAGLYTANVFQMGGALVSSVSSPFVPSKAALAYKTNDGAAAYGGVIKITDTSIDVVGTSYPRNTLKIGGGTTTSADQINGHIKSIRYFPRRLSNAQLQALTA